MSWKDAISYVKNISGHTTDLEKHREDKGLPLGARIGGLLNLQLSDFIRASANGSLVKTPESTMMHIVAISKLRLGLNGDLHRFYTSVDEDAESFLQVFTKPNGDIAELMYCTKLVRLIPETAEEQAVFLGEGEQGLGALNYTLEKAQIESLGLDAATVAGVFGAFDAISYQRDIGPAHREFFAPLKGTETRIDDAHGENGLKQTIHFMPYVRSLGSDSASGKEYLVITSEVIHSQDGDDSRRGIHVDFMIGVELDPHRVSVQ